ncbi:hypothetical protein J3R30DRAFT_2191625 [Lentinula aciculospora]|uniref:Uncharacterized protein n=1 Tax=Lentinula aciculospora TaxID=153920 RepID=A0A9W9DRZ3_9AGAR|nr:hypothetical protein J3R30DRAFT_2191625 [Lentinula aciculospora]
MGCDFNMHMSNSSYPKILDFARTKASLELFPQFLRVGGHVALSSTHFHFINELPLFSKYQIRLSIGAWDEKWCYIVCRFVTQTKTKEKRNSNNGTLNPPRILVNGLPPPLNENLNGLKLHTIAVSRICFKHGRITVPPAIVFATNGMSMYPWEVAATATLKSSRVRLAESTVEASASLSPFAAQEFSHTNPPPSWTNHARQLIAKTHGGDEAKLREFYRGGWRFVDTLTQRIPSRCRVTFPYGI